MQSHQQEEKNKKENAKKKIFTKELIGSIIIVISIATLFILLTGNTVFGTVGQLIKEFIFGISGSVLSYGLLLFSITVGILLIVGNFFKLRLKTSLLSVALFALIVGLWHALTMQAIGVSATATYADFIVASYQSGKESLLQVSAGGAIFSLLIYPFTRLLSYIGTYIILSLAIVAVGYFLSYEKIKKLFSLFSQNKATDKPVVKEKDIQPKKTNKSTPIIQVVQPNHENQSQEGIAPILQEKQYAEHMASNPSMNDNGLPNILGKQYANYTNMPNTAPTVEKKEPKEQIHSYMYNGIFDSESYFNKRHLQNATNSTAPSYQSTLQTQNVFTFEEPVERNIFENHSTAVNSASGQTEQTQQPISYSSIYAKENEVPRQSSLTKPIVTTGSVDAFTQNRANERQVTPSIATTIQDRDFMWGAGREVIQPRERSLQDNVVADMPQNDRNFFENANTVADGQASTPYFTQFVDARNLSTPTVQPIVEEDKNTVTAEEQTNSRQMPPSRMTMPESLEEPTRARNIFNRLESDNLKAENETALDMQSQEQQKEISNANVEDNTATAAHVGRQLNLQEDALENSNAVVEEDNIDSQINLSTQDTADINDVKEDENLFSENQSYENIFDSDFTMPDEISNVIEGLQAIEEKQEEISQKAEPAISQIEREKADKVYSSKDYRGLTPNFLQKEQPEKPKPKKRMHRKYSYPPLELFQDIEGEITVSEEEKEKNSNIIIATLKGFNISAEIVSITCGPAVTRYDIDIPGNIPTSKVFAYRNELAMRLQSSAGVNIQNNYSNGSISIEVPNRERSTVGLKEILNDKSYKENCKRAGSLVFSLGKDIEGGVVYGDITKMKHLLVAGATGTGKSVFLNSLIISLIAKYSPEDLRIILIDPKQVEFSIYSKLPHLMVDEIICEATKVINVLNWSISEMERRYGLFKEKGKTVHVRDIDEYNAHLTEEEEKLPKIVLIIDEVADLMQQAKKDIEDRIQSLTQKSRAAGIHLVLATQRPSVNVITGVIKANLPSRVAFKVAQDVDSRTILDSQGAENLLGKGDMLYKLEDMTMPARVQASYLSSEEVQKVVEYIKSNNESYFDESIIEFLKNTNQCENEIGEDGDNIQAVYIEALDIAITSGQVSISMIQRKLSVGYNKAGRIIEWMEHMGYISAFDGAKARRILITREEFEAKYGDYNS